MTKPARGIFISVEGGDGAGKSTQISLLADLLRKQGRTVLVTREPGGSPGAELIRALLVKGDKDRWSPLTEALLMYASRRDHLEKTILPALKRGDVVITDRFADSSMAYQGVAGGVGAEALSTLHHIVVGDDGPDLTIILDAPAEMGLARADATGGETRFEQKGAAFQEQVRAAFLNIAKENPQRCALVDASGDKAAVASRIEMLVKQKFPDLLA